MSEIADAVPQEPLLRYSRVAVALHWLTATLLVIQVVVGFTFHRLFEQGTPERMELFTWHKTLGATILIIALVRLLYRWMNPPPPFPPELPRWERVASVWTHRTFYLLLIVVPLTGLIAVSDRGPTTGLIGGIPLPTVPGITEATGDLSGEIHRFLVYGTLLLLVAHIVAPLWHRFILRDRTTARMPPFTDPAGEPAVVGQGAHRGEG